MRSPAPLAGLLLLLSACGDVLGPSGEEGAFLTPTLVSSSLTFTSIAATGHHTCAVATDGSTYCWGKNQHGELGTSAAMDTCKDPLLGPVPCTGSPTAVSGSVRFVSLAGSLGHGRTCGLTSNGEAYCWGFGAGGQLGDGSRISRATPGPVAGGLQFEALRVGSDGFLTCGIARDGHTYCWGVNSSGQLGNGTKDSMEPVPVRVTSDSLRFTALDLGEGHACGLTTQGEAYCWGANWYGTLGVGSAGGNGGLMESTVPLPVMGDHRFRSIVAGSNQTCALTEGGAAYCWGMGASVGSSAGAYVPTPQAVAGGHLFRSLHAGSLHTCGLTEAGELYCWGQNYGGELGDGTTQDRAEPVRVKTDVRFASLSHRPYCGLATDGRAYCWGDNPYGQVGQKPEFAK